MKESKREVAASAFRDSRGLAGAVSGREDAGSRGCGENYLPGSGMHLKMGFFLRKWQEIAKNLPLRDQNVTQTAKLIKGRYQITPSPTILLAPDGARDFPGTAGHKNPPPTRIRPRQRVARIPPRGWHGFGVAAALCHDWRNRNDSVIFVRRTNLGLATFSLPKCINCAFFRAKQADQALRNPKLGPKPLARQSEISSAAWTI